MTNGAQSHTHKTYINIRETHKTKVMQNQKHKYADGINVKKIKYVI